MDYIQRTFAFDNFQQANHFIQSTGKYCTKKDHHPFWELKNNGKELTVTLTSHFAGNKVTLFDFELAEEMNKQYALTKHDFRLYPLFSQKSWGSFVVALMAYFTAVLGVKAYKKYTEPYPDTFARGGKHKFA